MSSGSDLLEHATLKNHPRYKNLILEGYTENGIWSGWELFSDIRGRGDDMHHWAGRFRYPTERQMDEDWDETVDMNAGSTAYFRVLGKLRAQEARFVKTERAQNIAVQRRKLVARKAGLASAAARRRRQAGVLEQTAEAIDGAIDALFGTSKKKRRRR